MADLMTQISVGALQLAFSNDIEANIANVTRLVREAAARGARVILPPELFEGEYFCRVEDEGLFANGAVRQCQADRRTSRGPGDAGARR
jgi:N-carbamoylputrescine amidase